MILPHSPPDFRTMSKRDKILFFATNLGVIAVVMVAVAYFVVPSVMKDVRLK